MAAWEQGLWGSKIFACCVRKPEPVALPQVMDPMSLQYLIRLIHPVNLLSLLPHFIRTIPSPHQMSSFFELFLQKNTIHLKKQMWIWIILRGMTGDPHP
jgi:hypothetical protein